MNHTPGPWVWTAGNAGPDDEYGCSTRGPINLATHKSPGYLDNPELYSGDVAIISAGAGEYNPVHGATPDERIANARLIAAAPDLLAAVESLMEQVEQMRGLFVDEDNAIADALADGRDAIAKAKGA